MQVISPEPWWAEAGGGVQETMMAGGLDQVFALARTSGSYSYGLLLLALSLVQVACTGILK